MGLEPVSSLGGQHRLVHDTRLRHRARVPTSLMGLAVRLFVTFCLCVIVVCYPVPQSDHYLRYHGTTTNLATHLLQKHGITKDNADATQPKIAFRPPEDDTATLSPAER